MFEEVYKLFETYLQNVPELKYIGLFRNQFNNIEGERSIPYPAALIEMLPISFDNYGDRIQNTTMNVNIHIGQEMYKSIELNDSQKDEGLTELKLIDNVYKALDNINTLDDADTKKIVIGGVRRTGITPVTPTSALMTTIMNFEMSVIDGTAQPDYITQSGNTLQVEFITGLTFV